MKHLSATTELFRWYLGGSVTTNKLHCNANWIDKTSSSSTPGDTYTESDNTNKVTAVGSPGASTQRIVVDVSITNRDTVSAEVFFQWYDGSNERSIIAVTLAVGSTLQYVKDSGWSVIDADGITLTGSGGGGGIADGDTLATGLTFPNTGLHVLDTDGSHDLIIKPGSDITSDRTLTVTTGDANRTLTISGDTTLGGGSHSGTNTGDQTITLTGAVTGSGTGSIVTTLALGKVFAFSCGNFGYLGGF